VGVPIFDHTLYKYCNNQTSNKGKITNSIKDHDNSALGHGWLNELDSWNTYQLIQAYHQYGVGLRPAF
jgi:hypothetical protein